MLKKLIQGGFRWQHLDLLNKYWRGLHLFDFRKTNARSWGQLHGWGLNITLVIQNNCADRMASSWRRIIQISALSTFDGRIEAYHGDNG